MFAITINEKRNEIVVTKKFAEAAKRFGSEEYRELREVKMDYPTFKVVTRKVKSSKKETMKGLTYNYMEHYIEKHDDAEKSIMAQYIVLRAKSAEAEEVNAAAASYQEIKDWFLGTYPAIAAFTKKQEEILAKVKVEKTTKVVSIQKTEEIAA